MGQSLSSRRAWAAAVIIAVTVPIAGVLEPDAALAKQPDGLQQQFQVSANEASLLQIYDLLRDQHWPQPNEKDLLNGAIKGMLETLDDPYTQYMTAEEYQNFVRQVNQSYDGIGIRVGEGTNGFHVEAVFPSSPAESAGLHVGDRIVAVNGKSTFGLTVDQVSGNLRGAAGSSITLQVERDDKPSFTVTLTRKPISLPTLTSRILDQKTGYIHLLTFGGNEDKDFGSALTDLQKKGIDSLILDLRGNGGGLIDSAIRIADRFLDGGLITRIKTRIGEEEITAQPGSLKMPLVILVDADTASASELLAGALQTQKRAKLIGQKTFGKGVVQTVVPTANGDVLKLTFAQYYFADGSSPNKLGLQPDVVVASPALQLVTALETLHPSKIRSVKFDLDNQKTYVNHWEVPQQTVVQRPDGQVFLPLRFLVEAFGSEVNWKPEGDESFQYNNRYVELSASDGTLTVNGQVMDLPQPFLAKDGITFISLDAVKAVLQPDQVRQSDRLIEMEVGGTSL
ncbi:S41 family peptidase [Effusibacillus dendaii]|uniref:PDZ domain-containing protein n=1 Tax=Effusibacillus dendaii TaxID=2743772 RepID=A0A7I8DCM4_9BACL|nr:S41 family peptidase [Effusibacillus dendaii]BCJ87834.1 hypothetical protein skT53_28190 [Effusibacillus dendaii]